LPTELHPILGACEPDLIAARVHRDPEVLLDDPQRALAVAVQRGGELIVVEDECLTTRGLLRAQWGRSVVPLLLG
jgi:hypothetical protein